MHRLKRTRHPGNPVLPVLLAVAVSVSGREISSYAFVNDDATLRIRHETIHLYGIHIPETGRTCRMTRNPPVCGQRAVLALEFKIDGFVRCELLEEKDDGSRVGRCFVESGHFDEGEDLSAYLLERGWAVALPDAPVAYQALEKIARSRGVGLWGIPVDMPGTLDPGVRWYR